MGSLAHPNAGRKPGAQLHLRYTLEERSACNAAFAPGKPGCEFQAQLVSSYYWSQLGSVFRLQPSPRLIVKPFTQLYNSLRHSRRGHYRHPAAVLCFAARPELKITAQ